MARDTPILFVMFAIVLVSAIFSAVAWYWGTEDWTWMAQQNASLILVFITLAIAMFALVGWLRGRR